MKLKYRWSISNNGLSGIPANRWWKLLKENEFAVDPVYYHRVAFLTTLSLVNSLYSKREERIYGAAIEKTKITQAPVFILGHYRCGTTHLHYLLAQDTAQFAYPNNYQISHPFSFLSGEKTHAKALAPFLSEKRPFDNMSMSLQSPQEEEYALGMASFCSPFLSYSFPRRYEGYHRYHTFNDVSTAENESWKAALVWFTKKLTLRYRRRLVLKSPPHMSRIKLLLQVFPDAYFIHISRDPYTVYQSSRHLYDIAPWYMYLQRPDVGYTDERIIKQYNDIHDNYFRDKDLIPGGRFHDMKFEALEQDPVKEMALVYEKFGFDFQEFKPRLQRYLDSIADYKKNTYPEILPPLRQKLAQEWQRSFEAWEYPI